MRCGDQIYFRTAYKCERTLLVYNNGQRDMHLCVYVHNLYRIELTQATNFMHIRQIYATIQYRISVTICRTIAMGSLSLSLFFSILRNRINFRQLSSITHGTIEPFEILLNSQLFHYQKWHFCLHIEFYSLNNVVYWNSIGSDKENKVKE